MSIFDGISLAGDKQDQVEAWRADLAAGTRKDRAVLLNLEAETRVGDVAVREAFVIAAAKAYNESMSAREAVGKHARTVSNARQGPEVTCETPKVLAAFFEYDRLFSKLSSADSDEASPPPGLPTKPEVKAGGSGDCSLLPASRLENRQQTAWSTDADQVAGGTDITALRDKLAASWGPGTVIVRLEYPADAVDALRFPTVCDAGDNPAWQAAEAGWECGYTRSLCDNEPTLPEYVHRGPAANRLTALDPASADPTVPPGNAPDGYLDVKVGPS